MPITKERLLAIVARELECCSPELRAFFDSIRVDAYQVPLERMGQLEPVFVVAEHESKVVYYDDVESSFELAEIEADGVIRDDEIGLYDLRLLLSTMID